MPILIPLRTRADFRLSNTFLVASLFCMCVAEGFMIRRLWLRPITALHAHRGFDLPFLVWIPLFCAFLFLQVVRRRSRDGHISPPVATNLSSGNALRSDRVPLVRATSCPIMEQGGLGS
jgi:hypothetical protein